MHQVGLHRDKAEQEDFVFFDRGKATVSRVLLIDKLHTFAVNGTSLNWFHSYLTARRQRVVTEGGIISMAPSPFRGTARINPWAPTFLVHNNDSSDWVTSLLMMQSVSGKLILEPNGCFCRQI